MVHFCLSEVYRQRLDVGDEMSWYFYEFTQSLNEEGVLFSSLDVKIGVIELAMIRWTQKKKRDCFRP